MSGGVKVTLSEPITVGSELIREVTLRKPKLGDLVGMPDGLTEFGKASYLIATLADMLPPVVAELSIADTQTLSNEIGKLMGKSPKTGRKSPGT